ncbi:MAG: N-acetylneuraminate synthase [Planctomycetota bacterium]|nr:MAG: N-acetylneuraminate synthase [Planctomycetota bacterium]
MARVVELNGRSVGDGYPNYIIAEIGINHNGSLEIAKKLIDVAKASGCDAVKFQKRTPEKCVPAEVRDKMRETPWGYITYLEYRYKVEFGEEEFAQIDNYCRAQKIQWFVSCWDPDSVEFMKKFKTPCIKVPSASLTDRELLESVRDSGHPAMLSTGMSNMDQIDAAVKLLGTDNLLLAHATSTYPCPKEELNLRMITTLRGMYPCPIGYSGHEVGLATTLAAVALGASFLERHITLDRAMWGSDQAASIEPGGLKRLVKDVRNVELALGDGKKQVYESEVIAASRLRLRDTLKVHAK